MNNVFAPRFFSLFAACAALFVTGLVGERALAQDDVIELEGILDEIVITATKREETLQEVPISVATLQGENLNVLFSGSEDILALSGRVPGLYAESSNGRAAPRFYLRGLGNIDFDLAASQPVSIIMDEVVLENTVLKSFPLFDVQNIEVIRGPQGTLFGRNTIAGIVKVNTNRPDHETSGYIRGSYATFATTNVEGAIGGSLIEDTLAVRVSALARSRDNWITNANTGKESLGKYDEYAGRIQLEWTPGDVFSALLSYQRRDMDGTSSIFRANVFDTGSNALNRNYNRDVVYYDGGDDNPQGYQGSGTTLNLTWNFDEVTASSITSFQEAVGSSRGDIDGGVVNIGSFPTAPPGVTFADIDVFGVPSRTWPGPIFTPSVTEDGADTKQFTQEFRIANDGQDRFNWQIGLFYFDSDLKVETESFASFEPPGANQLNTIVQQENKAWAIFGQGSFDITDTLTFTAGVRFTDDEKDFQVLQYGRIWTNAQAFFGIVNPISVSDDQLSYEASLNYALNDDASMYVRYANGFRAQTIQGRDVAFLERPTVADPETINSIEAGYKADFLSNRARVNFAVFGYEVDDMQFSIIGGATNTNQVVNADQGKAYGFELDADFLLTDNLRLSGGFAFNDTQIKDENLSTAPCGSGLCTPTNPREDPNDPNNPKVLVDGNPFPRAPRTTYNLSVRYGIPTDSGEFYLFTDWAWYGEINMPLYDAVEFRTKDQYEGGLRVGYQNFDNGWEFAAFGRNITNENNVLGYIDFSNNTGFVNEPRVWGIEVGYTFGD